MNEHQDTPVIARDTAYYTELEEGRNYFWCRCGRSRTQPFCDGRHQGTDFRPVRYKATTKGEEVLFCGCKHTTTPPFCDGSHNNVCGSGPMDNPLSESNRAVPEVAAGVDARAVLNGGCYVFSVEKAEMTAHGTLRFCTIIGAPFGAIYQSQFYFEVEPGESPVVAFGERDAVLFMSDGDAEVSISGRTFVAETHSGVYVAPGEAFPGQRNQRRNRPIPGLRMSARRGTGLARPDAGQL